MHATLPTGRTRVLVVGAGQAGLAVAYHLGRLGLRTADPASSAGTVGLHEVVVVDRAPGPGGAWQFRWEALRLGAAHRVHDLPGMGAMGLHFADADPERPARDVVAEYYGRYEANHGIHVDRPVEVVRVADGGRDGGADAGGGNRGGADDGGADDGGDRGGGDGGGGDQVGGDRGGGDRGWAGDLVATLRAADGTSGELRTAVLVNASGTWGTPFVPWYPGRDRFAGRQLDTTGYRSAEEFRGQDVVVVGGGTSAIGFVLELDGVAASVTWCTRRPVDWRDESTLGVESAVAAVAEQDAAARAGSVLPSIVHGTAVPVSPRIRSGLDRGVLVPRPVPERIEPDGVRLADGSFHHADAIIWATGFRPDVRHLGPLGLRTPAGGIEVAEGQAIRDPRVFLAGYGPQASTLGADRAGRSIARRVLARLERGAS
ncbi:pyridine nucleotide-disulfide oxidoreductase [Curtobacterium sp. MCBD17_035]|uniref:pyridine nucleotide-disulfide oxidoreductase n=1 Tax=Curtobacterium sp. MCBD17_035 TaxID=2175673 RepID=UPI0024DF4C71|nr:pyridine nucleotide-disulfide oxidoreductase [Curtobacterium sp. MCBD17_035]WIB68024.1 pyridine nucleotide-disulfide oxidoreductase [Curtobacterium sp. MCBD17_035]